MERQPDVTYDVDAMAKEISRLQSKLAIATAKLEKIVCTAGCDRGVICLSHESPTHTEIINGTPMTVYDHENFSPLGDALVELHDVLTTGGRHYE